MYRDSQLLAVQQSGVNWVHEDPIAKSKRVTNSSGAVVSTIELDSWGADTNRSINTAFQPKKFTSYERDSNGTDEAMFRRHNRWMSRFDQPDPYDGSYDLSDPQSFNRYAYVQNDPVNFVDPTGLDLPAPDDVIEIFIWDWPWPDGFSAEFGFTSAGTGGRNQPGGIGGVGGGGGLQNPKEPHAQQQRNPSCLDFADQLVQKVFDAPWYTARGDVGNGMMSTAKQNPYEKYMPRGMNDSNGFKQRLTQYGHSGDVYRHVLFFAGGTLSRLQPVLWEAERVDRKQAQTGRKESITELADDQAGRHVGSLMDQAFDKKFDRNGLRDILRKELCK